MGKGSKGGKAIMNKRAIKNPLPGLQTGKGATAKDHRCSKSSTAEKPCQCQIDANRKKDWLEARHYPTDCGAANLWTCGPFWLRCLLFDLITAPEYPNSWADSLIEAIIFIIYEVEGGSNAAAR